MSQYVQKSFSGGMNLIADDTRIGNNQYVIGFNLRNRDDVLEAVLESQRDVVAATLGIKQELVTFGEYRVLFAAGKAYYSHYTQTGWIQIQNFQMSSTAPRFWTVQIPVSTTNYYRIAATSTIEDDESPSANGPINLNAVTGAAQGNLPGLLVQDNQNQPVFVFIGLDGLPTSRVTQTFEEWSISFTDDTNTVVATGGDKREYVPIGNAMAWVDDILYITSPDRTNIYRSVQGRPLDFVVNVKNTLATDAPYKQTGGGDARTTSYTVGVGGISALRPLSSGALFVAASGSNFAVSKNTTPGARLVFGEYTFIREFLFNSTCLSDRVILDSDGDTRFISLTGIRSFNAILQSKNEGRNSLFSSNIQKVFGQDDTLLTQDKNATAAILYDDYELYAVNTLFGPAIAVYDTVLKCWSSFDVSQTGGKAIKMFAKIELSIQRLYAVTVDDELYTLYIGPNQSLATFRTISISSTSLRSGEYSVNPEGEHKLSTLRVVLDECTEAGTVLATPYVNNRLTPDGTATKVVTYTEPTVEDNSQRKLSDVNTQLNNLFFSFPSCRQGWKTWLEIGWTTGVFVQFMVDVIDQTPQNPLQSQTR